MNTAVFCVCGYTVKNIRQMTAHEKGLGHRTRMHAIERQAAGFMWIQTRYRSWFEAAGLAVEEGPGKFYPKIHAVKRGGAPRPAGVERVLWVSRPLAQIVTCGREETHRRVFLLRFSRFDSADRSSFLRALDAAIRLSSAEDALNLIFNHVPGDAMEVSL